MKNFPLIGILVPRKKDRKRIMNIYQEFCRKDLSLQLCSFTPGSVSLPKKIITGIIKTDKGLKETVLPLPNAVYNRCYNKSAREIRSIEVLIGQKCFNAVTHLNKWEVYTLLKAPAFKIYLPDTVLYDGNSLTGLLAEWKLLYIKPVHGNKGKKVYRLELEDSGNVLISSHSMAPFYIIRKNEEIPGKVNPMLGNKKYLMQKGVLSTRVNQCFFDIRVLVQKNIDGNWAVSFIACRVAYDDYFNTSIFKKIYDAEVLLPRLLKQEASLKLLHTLNDLSIGVAETLERHLGRLGELGIDFILDENKQLWIIEVNGKPQKSIYDGIENFKQKALIYQRPLEYAYYLAQLPPGGKR